MWKETGVCSAAEVATGKASTILIASNQLKCCMLDDSLFTFMLNASQIRCSVYPFCNFGDTVKMTKTPEIENNL